jgi:2-amino-4-hydroxy-6-hydroxymethyldihydropteridine diphosphokinase
MKTLVYVGVGSNHDPARNLRAAVVLLQDQVRVLTVSPVYETEATGGATGGASYLNAVVIVDTEMTPPELEARVLKPIEKLLGRSKEDPAVVAIDLDVLVAVQPGSSREEWMCSPNDLDIPHIVVPLADVGPELRHPITGEAIQTVAARLRGRQGVSPRPDMILTGG